MAGRFTKERGALHGVPEHFIGLVDARAPLFGDASLGDGTAREAVWMDLEDRAFMRGLERFEVDRKLRLEPEELEGGEHCHGAGLRR